MATENQTSAGETQPGALHFRNDSSRPFLDLLLESWMVCLAGGMDGLLTHLAQILIEAVEVYVNILINVFRFFPLKSNNHY